MSTPPLYLTPSELALLNGEKFAQPAGLFGKTRLLHIDQDVNEVQLVQQVLAAAFLGCEQYGALRLEVRSKKVLLGLGSSQALFADLGPQPVQWPGSSVEAGLLRVAYQLAPAGRNDIYQVVIFWLGRDYFAPFDEVLSRVKEGLAQRGVLSVTEERKLKIFVSRKYALPEAWRGWVAAQPVQPLLQLLQYTRQARPQVYNLLMEQVKKAVKDREEKPDTDTD